MSVAPLTCVVSRTGMREFIVVPVLSRRARGIVNAYVLVKAMSGIATTNRFYILLTVSLLFSPVICCATTTVAISTSAPSGCPRHPTPAPQDCAMAGCVCLATKAATHTLLGTEHPVLNLVLTVGTSSHALQNSGSDLTAIEFDAFARGRRFVANHQFRI